MAESQSVEYKESWRDKYLKWVCGFANAQGGTIYIGIDDSGNPVGVKNIKKLMEDIPNKIQSGLGIVADVNKRTKDGVSYIEIKVKPSSFPVSYHGEYHYRSGSTKQQLTGIALSEFIMRKTGFRWEDVTVDDISVEDLDDESFKIFRREAAQAILRPGDAAFRRYATPAGSWEQTCRNMSCVEMGYACILRLCKARCWRRPKRQRFKVAYEKETENGGAAYAEAVFSVPI